LQPNEWIQNVADFLFISVTLPGGHHTAIVC